ncbi:ABC transporter permease [Streptomyces umbrinus]
MSAPPRPSAVPSPSPVRLPLSDVLLLGLIGIRTRRIRAALSALGISIGIATMIVVTGIPASSQRALEAELTALGTNRLKAVADSSLTEPGETVAIPKEAAAMVSRIGPVNAVTDVANTHATARRSERIDSQDAAGLLVLAARRNLPEVLNAKVRSGSYLTAVTERFPAAVLGSVAAARLGHPDLVAGEPPPQVLLGNRWFSVVGILRSIPLAPDIDRSVLVGWDAARDNLGFDGRPTLLFVQADESAVEDVHAVLPETIAPDNPGLVKVSRPSNALAAKRSTQANFSGLFVGLAGVALLVGGIGVANTMVISVLDRRREIGLRRALGASRGQIRSQFLAESVALSCLGGIAGVLIGVLATVAYAAYRTWPLVFPLPAVGSGLGGAILVGILAGVYPAVRASRLPPTEALSAT